MCGIAGFVGVKHGPDASGELLRRMIETLRHRGPDGFGYFVGDGIGLAHARLAIIDLATGSQPVRNERGTVWTVLNGEIFNYLELRRMLEALGHRFYTQSDTEVIVHLYEQYGDDFVDHLNGQFALALWDGEQRRLLLARDRTGIRPLFHAGTGGMLWFGSEIKALLAALPQLGVLDPRGVAQAMTYWGVISPDTVFQGVQSVPPGHVLVVEADGRRSLRRYWDWVFPDCRDGHVQRPFGSMDEAAGALRELLIDAVRLQLRADVAVGAYLSGGLDSSAVVALVRHFTTNPLRTFSVAFEDAEFDESGFQARVVSHLETEHTTLHCTRRDIGEAFPRLIEHAESPLLRTAGVPLMLLAAHVHDRGFRVVLTGEGADEVFGGYDLFKEAKIRRFWARQPSSTWRPLLLRRLYGYLDHSPVANAAMARSFFGRGMEHGDRPVFAHMPRWSTSQRALAFFSPSWRAEVQGWDPLTSLEETLPSSIAGWSPLARDQYVEAHTLLSAYLLPMQGDRPAMAHSVEGRFPFLDHRVVEFGNRLPDHWKIRGLNEKYILRRALAGLLPEDIRFRVKQPYRAPDHSSFFFGGEPLDYVADVLGTDSLREAGYFDPGRVGRLFDKCRRGDAVGFADNQAFVGILSTMLLHRQRVRRMPVP
ncbi:MAG: asparagine synthase (glutamine-hydrolyzing) [Xanthomonadaceae bacterium]|nr:asparagine synthase (glutamine-hydrolyzing) [Xanthomonadaceae bacterium]MDE1963331.1 asparagine synthase (glutamine-hydrolyzing) [Xanthomonadaceae bacterium]